MALSHLAPRFIAGYRCPHDIFPQLGSPGFYSGFSHWSSWLKPAKKSLVNEAKKSQATAASNPP